MLKALLTQWFPSKPTFTEKDVPDQAGKVFIVTGSNQGVGYALVELLYSTGATVYLACRNEAKANAAIEKIQSTSTPATPATLKFLHLDLNDLDAIKKSAATFAAQESRLDIIWHNAGWGNPNGSSTAQGIEGNIGQNCVAPFLFTQLVLPQLRTAVASAGEARVVWTASALTELKAPKGGLDFAFIDAPTTGDTYREYAAAKIGNYLLAIETARRYGSEGIVGVAQNPGNLKTAIYDGQPYLLMLFTNRILYEPRYGAYTGLFAGFTKEVTATKNNGVYIWPWGTIAPGGVHSRADINQAIEDGLAKKFWEWCEVKAKAFL